MGYLENEISIKKGEERKVSRQRTQYNYPARARTQTSQSGVQYSNLRLPRPTCLTQKETSRGTGEESGRVFMKEGTKLVRMEERKEGTPQTL